MKSGHLVAGSLIEYMPLFTSTSKNICLVCTVLDCTVLYYMLCFLYCTLSCCNALICTVHFMYCTVLHCTVLYCTALYCTALYCNRLYWAFGYNGLKYVLQRHSCERFKYDFSFPPNIPIKPSSCIAFLSSPGQVLPEGGVSGRVRSTPRLH